ncbi:MAG: DNA primase [Thermaerobacter sp.]|nr:DNA primase [Thermaerobacter sp.]
MRLSREFVQQVRDRNDLVEVVGEYLPLQRRGKTYVGLCPFHAERTPSFGVSPDKQLFYCFGCGEGGDLFTFVMKKDGLSFQEAVVSLAERAGLTVPEADDPVQLERWRRQEALLAVLEAACVFFCRMLAEPTQGRAARAYLSERGVSEEAMARFRLGYAPPAWEALRPELTRQGFSPELAEAAGLLVRKERGFYDRFRERVIFPIADRRGRVVAFGGRSLDGSGAKYLNSPETEVFSKRRTLYGYHLAREGIRREGRAVLMEGYMDVLTAHQFGVDCAVGSLGTALTPEQVRLLADQAGEVVLAFDADSAGQRAARRGLEVFGSLPCEVRVLAIPEGKDPDEFLHRHGPEAFRRAVAEAPYWVQFLLDGLLATHDVRTAEGKHRVAQQFLAVLERLDSRVEQEEYLERLARRLGVSVEAVQQEAKGRRSSGGERSPGEKHKIPGRRENLPSQGDRTSRAEQTLVALMLQDEAARRQVMTELGPEDFEVEEFRALVEAMRDGAADAGEAWLDRPLGSPEASPDGEATIRGAQLGAWLLWELPLDNPERQLADCLEVLRERRRRRRAEEIKAKLREQAVPDPALLREMDELVRAGKRR